MSPGNPIQELKVFVTLGARELFGRAASVDDLAETLGPLDRDQVVRFSVRVLNALAYDRRLRDSQDVLVAYLPQAAQVKYRGFLADRPSSHPSYRLFHAFQQLILVHLAAKYAKGNTLGRLSTEEMQSRWAIASIQINDNLTKEMPGYFSSNREKMLYLFTEEVTRWELTNPSKPLHSLARMRSMLLEVPKLGSPYIEAAARLRDRFAEHLSLDFETAFNLTAFFIFWWELHSKQIPDNPDAALIDCRTWLERGSISRETLDRYVDRVAVSLDDIPSAFDRSGADSPFRDVLPFRSRPMLRIDAHGIAYLCPQFMAEKGGTDLLWLLASDPGGPQQARPFIQDFSGLYERYVRSILEELGPERVGGRYVPNVEWSLKGESGEIDGLIHFDTTLVVIEVKASLLKQVTLSRGSVEEIRVELERKFVTGGGPDGPKGVLQIVRAINWLAAERKRGKSVHGIDLGAIDRIVPMLVVHDRTLRFPGLGTWFDGRMRSLLRRSWGRIGPLTICGTEDLESLEHLALAGQGRLVDALDEYDRSYMRAEAALWNVYRPADGAHPRLDKIITDWMEELQTNGVLPLE